MSNGLYRLLYNQNLYLRAYAKIYSNQGSLTPGITDETADGMSLEKIQRIIKALRQESYWWSPVRRTYIAKANGKRRALGISVWSDRLLQEVIRSVLEAYYEPQFSDLSHGFRPVRGPDTALQAIKRQWTGTKWWIEGDIKGYFDNIDHDTLMGILARNIKDQRFLTLIRRFLTTQYMEDWKLIPNLTGTPQGGILSPLLSNIYLNELDQQVTTVLIPEYTRGTLRRANREYDRLKSRRHRLRTKGNYTEEKELTATLRQIPSKDPQDPNFRRLHYIRYADDFLLGFTGPKQEAMQIKAILTEYLRDNLKLELNQEKTLITHARSHPARFLGYDIQAQYADDQVDHQGRRSINGIIGLRVPQSVIDNHCQEYLLHGKSKHNDMLAISSDFTIIHTYGHRLRGIVQYYKLAYNVSHLWKLASIMQSSMLKTLARKYSSTSRKMFQKYKSVTDNGTGRAARCFEAIALSDDGKRTYVARFGGIPLRRDKNSAPRDLTLRPYTEMRSDLLTRLLADQCEICEVMGNIEVHHIRRMSDLNVKGQLPKKPWVEKMAGLQRKTLMVCRPCHLNAHGGKF